MCADFFKNGFPLFSQSDLAIRNTPMNIQFDPAFQFVFYISRFFSHYFSILINFSQVKFVEIVRCIIKSRISPGRCTQLKMRIRINSVTKDRRSQRKKGPHGQDRLITFLTIERLLHKNNQLTRPRFFQFVHYCLIIYKLVLHNGNY